MKRPLFLVCILLLVIVWLRLLSGGYERPPEDPFLCLREKERYTVIGQICKREENSFWIRSESICSENQGEKSSPESILKIKEIFICEGEGAEVPVGTRVTLSGEFALFRRASNPGEFDGFRYYRSLGVSGRFYNVSIEELKDGGWSVKETAYQIKCFLKARLFERLPATEAGMMSALLLGDKSELDAEQKDLYKRNGILHILSISSLHITILGMMLYRLLRRCGVPVVPAACIGSACLMFYGAMVGFSVSACRAIGMYLIRMLAEVFGRTYDCLTALGMLAAVMTIYRPFYLENTGFLLSFASVGGIGIVLPILTQKREEPLRLYRERHFWRECLEKLWDGMKSSVLASLSISLMTLPIQLWFYHEVPVWSVVINLLVLPFVKPLILLGLLCLLPFGGLFSYGPMCILGFYTFVCRWFDELAVRTWNPGHGALWQIAVYYGLLSIGLFWLRRAKNSRLQKPEKWVTYPEKKRGPQWGVLGGFLWLILAVGVYLLPERRGNRVIFLDVGQGNCILMQMASGENYLYDCGSSSRSEIGRYVCLPALKYYGVGRLDAVFVSHADADHINGIPELLTLAEENHLEIVQVVLPDIEEQTKAEEYRTILSAVNGLPGDDGPVVTYLAAGENWKIGTASFACLHPGKGMTADDSNAYSLVLLGDFGNAGVLLTGDLEAEGEKELIGRLSERSPEETMVLQTAHHGSGKASSEEFLQTLRPAASIISAGRNNRYGHPHKETLGRLEDVGSKVFCTAECGAVTVEFGREIRVKGFLTD